MQRNANSNRRSQAYLPEIWDREEKEREKAKEDVALGDREKVSGGKIIAPPSPLARSPT